MLLQAPFAKVCFALDFALSHACIVNIITTKMQIHQMMNIHHAWKVIVTLKWTCLLGKRLFQIDNHTVF